MGIMGKCCFVDQIENEVLAELQVERDNQARERLKAKYRQLVQAQKVVRNIENEIAELKIELKEGV